MSRPHVIAISVLFCCVAGCKAPPSEPEDEQQGSGGTGQAPGGGGSDAQSGDGSSASGSGANASGGGGSGAGLGGGGGGGTQASGTGGGSGAPGLMQDGGIPLDDGGLPPGFSTDGGVVGAIGMGSCCSEHDTPGCSNADLQVCVCEMVPSCCTEAWNAACVLFVTQKYCQPGVRECVCGDGPDQWQQHSCCELDWTDNFCDSVAVEHCGAVPGCM